MNLNSEISEIICILNFFRACDFLWKTSNHPLCESDTKSVSEACFYCYMRSSCLRLNQKRSKGPRSIKLIEFTSQLPQYQDKLGWNWMLNCNKSGDFIENTLKMLDKIENFIHNFNWNCQNCGAKLKPNDDYLWKTNHRKPSSSVKDILQGLIEMHGNNACCRESLKSKIKKKKFIILDLAHPTDIFLSALEEVFGSRIKYVSHIEETDGRQEQVFFSHGYDMVYQNSEDKIQKSSYGLHKNVNFLFISIMK